MRRHVTHVQRLLLLLLVTVLAAARLKELVTGDRPESPDAVALRSGVALSRRQPGRFS